MRFAGQDLADKEPLQSSLDALNVLECADLETCRCQYLADFIGRLIEIHIFFEPVIRNFHTDYLMFVVVKVVQKYETFTT